MKSPRPIKALDPGARSNQIQLHASGSVPESCHVLATWTDDAETYEDEPIGP